MSYLERINLCNQYDREQYKAFHIDDHHVGWVKHNYISHLLSWVESAHQDDSTLYLQSEQNTYDSRNQLFAALVDNLYQQGMIRPPMNEPYPVSIQNRNDVIALVDRVAAAVFGIRCYGQHMNGYVKEGDQIKMWIGRRAKDRGVEPGKLDQLVAGGLPHQVSLHSNLLKECWEEAGIPQELAQRAKAVGTVTYCADSSRGLKPDTLFNYDLELPQDFVPECTDGEVEQFYCMPIEEVAELVRDTEEFKHNCNLVVIDFLVRHGLINDDDPDYSTIVAGLHPTLPVIG
jgi:8-oxo-dGTP pyrophosphatase MutT (NUDIX family)